MTKRDQLDRGVFSVEQETAQHRAERLHIGGPSCQETASPSQEGLMAHISASLFKTTLPFAKVVSNGAAKLRDCRLRLSLKGALCPWC